MILPSFISTSSKSEGKTVYDEDEEFNKKPTTCERKSSNKEDSGSGSPPNEPFITPDNTTNNELPNGSRNQVMIDHPNCIKSGWIFKRGNKHKSWKRRFFLLMDEGYVFYYKTRQHSISTACHPLGVLYLKPSKEVFISKLPMNELIPKEASFGFALSVSSRRLVMACETSEEKDEWVEKISMVAYKKDTSASCEDTDQTLQNLENQTNVGDVLVGGISRRRRGTGDNEERKRTNQYIDLLESQGLRQTVSGMNEIQTLLLNDGNKPVKKETARSKKPKKEDSDDDNLTDSEESSEEGDSSNELLVNIYPSNVTQPVEKLSGINEYLMTKNLNTLKQIYHKTSELIKQKQEKDLEIVQLMERIKQLESDKQQLVEKTEEFAKHKKILVKEVKSLRAKLGE